MVLILLIILLIHLASPFFVGSQNFSFPTFDSSNCEKGGSLICLGSVSCSNGSLTITPNGAQETSLVGRVLFRYPILAWPASFSTSFTIRVTSGSNLSGDGVAFIIAQDDKPSPPESYGSYIGIMDPSTEGGFLRQLAVEFDTYKNPRDIDKNHIAIDTIDVEHPVAVRSLNDVGIDLKSGRNIRVKIDYDGLKKILQVHVAYADEPMVSFLKQKIIMEDTVPQQAYVGFTGSTGHISETHQILDWNFTMYALPEGSLGQGIGGNKPTIVLHILIPTLVVLAFAAILTLAAARRRRKARLEGVRDIEKLAKNAANAPKFFTYKQLAKATHGFNKENLLGTGGFGSVYKGILPNSDSVTTIAVKKINATSSQGEKEYLAEICTIGRLRHKNLVQLLGWCHDRKQLLLVYEYMPNGSLDRYIGKEFLNWETRYKILSGLASVLLYLHEECENPVVHRDVKPNNVMLDSNYNAHLGDFGLARLLGNDAFVATMVAGTIGYLAPEVSYTGRATPESDVYSFGMVVLEMVCGRRSRGVMEEFSLVDTVWNLHEKGALLSCVDRALSGRCHEEQVRRSLVVGLACLNPNQMERPKMRKVVQVFLNGDEPLMEVPLARPTEVCLSLPSSSAELGCSRVYSGGSMDDSPDEITIQYDGCFTK
ncbi:probable L-type lectin-domain containing receptor kinase S.5 [Salvia miltiorrhiza]|uniref:probable L-type lectin-domain containing receptor kinase S.5 n=1 Tax=Salvia miltiorrhiza TaxID=226208 RepID=UPI0025ABAD75|nr:probable L-type lectin-domain containing receptor kinase S.5 [Salvia miltiorrhiza]